jgi:hypothetical protein
MSNPQGSIHSTNQHLDGAVIIAEPVYHVPKMSDAISNVNFAFGYTDADIEELRGAIFGLSCGNPIATSRLREGEVVVDLGSKSGMDIITAARRVGSEGKAIGIDMTEVGVISS